MALEDKGKQHDQQLVDKFHVTSINYDMSTWDYVVRTQTSAALGGNIIVTLPLVSEAKGRFYTIVPRLILNGTEVTITDQDDSEGWGDITLDTLQSGVILYSDGCKWLQAQGAGQQGLAGNDGNQIFVDEGAPGAELGNPDDLYINETNGDLYWNNDGTWEVIGNMYGIDGQLWTVDENMDTTVVPYRFLAYDEATLVLAGESPPNGDVEVVGASYYLPPGHTTADPGLLHPLGCQALVELAALAAFQPGDLVFCGVDGKALDIAQLDADDGSGTDYFYFPVGYAVTAAGVDAAASDTHVEVFMFPYGGTGGVNIASKQGENQT